jgi:UDP-GlcNAc:undecaprenyl-phosphate GlcNAc-1-phosphate transferase
MPTEVLVAATALVASLSLTPAALRLALHLGVVDVPGPRKIHVAPTPLLGGLAIYAGTCVAVLLFAAQLGGDARPQIVGVLAAATLLVVVGTLDDRGVLHHQVKLFAGMPAAALILLAVGIRANVFVPLFGADPGWWMADTALTMLWIVGITAAFSILDYMDGLCAGIAAIAAASFVVLAIAGGQLLVGIVAAAVLGAAAGFLKWNYNPARVFMGSGGAMFLGFMMAMLGLKLRTPELPSAVAALVPVLVLGIPILDTTLVTVSRTRRGILPFASPGKDHVGHRLANLGFSQRRAVLVMYTAALGLGVVAVVVSRVPAGTGLLLIAAVFAAGLAAVAWLERCAFEQ